MHSMPLHHHCKTYLTVLLVSVALMLAGCAKSPQMQTQLEPNRPDVYIWPNSNSHSNNEATLTLLVQAGSLQEADDELGYAHFVEHMVFRGSEAFPGAAMQEQMDELGIEIGRHSNAYTAFDRTAYWINLNSVEPDRIESAIQLLAEWAFHAEIDTASVNQERSVIVEEWRQSEPESNRAQQRVREDYFAGSRLAERRPIGTLESIQNASAEGLRGFYDTWYQPENMAVIVTGDVDYQSTLDLVNQYFPPRTNTVTAKIPTVYDLNPEAMTDRLVVTDPFITDGYLELRYLVNEQAPQNQDEWLDRIALGAALDILVDRLDHRVVTTRGAVSGFQYSLDQSTPNVLLLSLGAGLSRDDFSQALNILEGERQRLLTDGIAQRELNEWRQGVLEYERSQQDSAGHLSNQVISHVLYGWPLMGQAEYTDWLNTVLPDLSTDDLVQALSRRMNSPAKMLVVHPHTEPAPTSEQLNQWLAEAAYVSNDNPLLDEDMARDWTITPQYQGSISAEQALDHGITHWQLSNGMDVFYTYSDAEPGRVSYALVGDGGYNRMTAADTPAGRLAAETISASGMRDVSGPDLNQWLQSHAIDLQAQIDFFDRVISGGSSTEAFPLAMNLLHIALTEAQVDPDVLAHHQTQNQALLEQLAAHPHRPWIDMVQEVLFLQEPALRNLTRAELDAVDAQRMLEVYEEHVSGAQNYRLSIVGDISRSAAQQAVVQAIATLPPTQDLPEVQRHYPAPSQSTEQRVDGSGERQATLVLRHSRPKADLQLMQRDDLNYLERWVNHRLNQDIREDQGLTYGIEASIDGSTRYQDDYTLVIYLNTDPAQVDKAIAAVNISLQEAQANGPDEAQLSVWQTTMIQEYRQMLNSPADIASVQAYSSLFERDVADSLNADVEDTNAGLLADLLAEFLHSDAVRQELVWLP
ncbi:MAG: insulinase family protein [Natronospirillum sp.]